MITNAQKLAAVLNKWVQPAIRQLAAEKLSGMPFFAALNNKVRSTGWVSPSWSLGEELAPLMGGISSAMIEPMIISQLRNIPDESLPQMAHSIIDEAIKAGQLSLFEGNVVFEVEDLKELKKLLEYNLPLGPAETYEVVTKSTEPEASGAEEQ